MPNTPKYGRGQVLEIINSVINKMDAGTGSRREIFQDIAELAQIIDSLKKDIASTRPEHVKNSHIPDATDELDAVVNHTAEATHTIMNMCEEIDKVAETLDADKKAEIESKTGQIYEACSFQDVTGQRIRNVIKTLILIETKIDSMLETLGNKVGLDVSDSKFQKVVSIHDEKSLLNGPQLSSTAISQDEIDRLLAEFDGK